MKRIVFGGGAGMTGGGHKDTSIVSTTPTRSYAGIDRIYVYDAGDVSPFVSLMRFELGVIPRRSIINSAVLRLYVLLLGAATNFSIHRLLTPWGVTDTNEGVAEILSTGGQATWDCAFDTNGVADVRWAAGGVFTAADFEAVAEDTQAALLGAWSVFNIPVMTQLWVKNRSLNNGCYLVANADTVQIASNIHATVGLRWSLTVDYTAPTKGKSSLSMSMGMM